MPVHLLCLCLCLCPCLSLSICPIWKEHSLRESHLNRQAESLKSDNLAIKIAKRSEIVGMRLGHIAYQTIYEGDSFASYSRKVATLALNGVDLGSTNHSDRFVTDFVTPLRETISEKIISIINTPLACTNEVPPLV